jgi:hypothetical protein
MNAELISLAEELSLEAKEYEDSYAAELMNKAAAMLRAMAELPSKRLWDETATALEVLRGKFHDMAEQKPVTLPRSQLLPCPFCGKAMDAKDHDTVYPTGGGWVQLGDIRVYRSFREVPKEQWCFGVHCSSAAGGCDAQVIGDSEAEAIKKWNARFCTVESTREVS